MKPSMNPIDMITPSHLGQHRTSKSLSGLARICLAAGFGIVSVAASAEDYVYQAITDFPDINAGSVPYYVDSLSERNVLAINAAVVEYREKFARATLLFAGESGTYDVTITALGEIDGEGEFRFLVNGEVKGSGVNELVTEDWGEQYHVFEDIQIAAGDELAVESDARSNGLIPENGEFAFARGRWRELALVMDAEVTANPVTVDLDVSVVATPQEVEEGQNVTLLATVSNAGDDVATNATVDINVPSGLSFESGNGCSVNTANAVVTCSLEEVSNSAPVNLSLEFRADNVGNAELVVSVEADQQDLDTANNAASFNVTVVQGAETLPDTSGEGIAESIDPGESDDTVGEGVAETVDSDTEGTNDSAGNTQTINAASGVEEQVVDTADSTDTADGNSDETTASTETVSTESEGNSGGSGQASFFLLMVLCLFGKRRLARRR